MERDGNLAPSTSFQKSNQIFSIFVVFIAPKGWIVYHFVLQFHPIELILTHREQKKEVTYAR